jgi:hypothetical protein
MQHIFSVKISRDKTTVQIMAEVRGKYFVIVFIDLKYQGK